MDHRVLPSVRLLVYQHVAQHQLHHQAHLDLKEQEESPDLQGLMVHQASQDLQAYPDHQAHPDHQDSNNHLQRHAKQFASSNVTQHAHHIVAHSPLPHHHVLQSAPQHAHQFAHPHAAKRREVPSATTKLRSQSLSSRESNKK